MTLDSLRRLVAAAKNAADFLEREGLHINVTALELEQASAAVDVDAIELLATAAKDALSGWRYIREHHGDLYGVGWDRVEDQLRSALGGKNGEGKA